MQIAKTTTQILAALLVLTVGSSAFAQEAPKMQPKQHPSFTKRNLPTPTGVVEVIAGPSSTYNIGTSNLFGIQNGAGLNFTRSSFGDSSNTAVSLSAGAAYGVNNDLSVGAMVLPLQIDPDFEYGNPSLFSHYRILRGLFEGVGRVAVTIPVLENANLGIQAGGLFRKRDAGFRIDFGLLLDIELADETVLSLNAPVAAYFQATPEIFAGLKTGVNVFALTEDGAGDRINIPLALEGGYTLSNAAGPMADLSLNIGFPAFYNSGSGDITTFDLLQVGIGASYYLTL